MSTPPPRLSAGSKPGFSSGQAMDLMQGIAERILPAGMHYQWTAMSYQEKLAGSATVLVFGLSLVLVYFVLAGQYENWITPLAVLLAVPLAVLGTVLAMKGLGLPEQHLRADRPRPAHRALGEKRHPRGRDGPGASRRRNGHHRLGGRRCALRFRPIIMTSVTLYSGRGASHSCDRSEGLRPQMPGRRRGQWHAGFDLPGGCFCALLLRCAVSVSRSASV